MKIMRMPKGWTLVGTNALEFGNTETRQERIRREQKFNNAIRNVKSQSVEDMKKESDELFDAKNAENAQLLQAFKDKKLKSKALIKKAKALKKKEKEAAKKAAEAKSAKVATA